MQAIEDCDKAVEHGRELRADYKTIAKALSRKGNAQVKQGKLEEAIETYNKSLTEHRYPSSWLSVCSTSRFTPLASCVPIS